MELETRVVPIPGTETRYMGKVLVFKEGVYHSQYRCLEKHLLERKAEADALCLKNSLEWE